MPTHTDGQRDTLGICVTSIGKRKNIITTLHHVAQRPRNDDAPRSERRGREGTVPSPSLSLFRYDCFPCYHIDEWTYRWRKSIYEVWEQSAWLLLKYLCLINISMEKVERKRRKGKWKYSICQKYLFVTHVESMFV